MSLVDIGTGFLYGWDIDKIVDFRDSSVDPNLSLAASPGTTVVNLSHAYGYRPTLLPQYKPSTQNAWYELGGNTQLSSSQLVGVDLWVGDTTIAFIVENNHASSVTVELRYWVLADDN